MTNLTDQQLIEKCESHINALRYEGYNWKELAELLTRFRSLTENRHESAKNNSSLIDACKTVVEGYETDGMENMDTRDHVFYRACKDALSSESAKTGVEVWQILDAVKDCSSFEDISNTNESCCDVDMIKLRTALTKLLEK